ncbi:MAG: HIT family protein [Anaerolineae bacterium]
MNRLWSPWRMAYIAGSKPKECVFCQLPSENQDATNLILFRGKLCYVMLNRYPYNNGHLMVIPYQHVNTPLALDPTALGEMMDLNNLCLTILGACMHPDGFNIGMNLGTPAGAGIKDHIHLHVVPRWTGDTNYMPVIGETRVISESLDATYIKLKRIVDRFATTDEVGCRQ